MGEWPIILLLLCIVRGGVGTASSPLQSRSFNVMNYGAVGDGKADDSQAFLKAWKAVCGDDGSGVGVGVAVLVIPAKTFMLMPADFTGPCKPSNIHLQVSGNLVAPNTKWAWKGYHTDTWLSFSYVNGLTITGPGQINGQGSAWWPNACLHNEQNAANCKGPTALTFNRCNGLQLNGLTHINPQRRHITVMNCKGVAFSNLRIIAPGTSPNTDGINIAGSSAVQIRNCNIATGDDCIAISGGSSNINITGITCGPGHGISIGALGHGGFDTVEDVHVRNCTLKGTMTGVRIKSWQGGSGYARRISFQQIKFVAVSNPILIDQFYCPSRVDCQNKTSAVQLSDISYYGIVGTSATDSAINLSCSQVGAGCTNIKLDRVYIASATPGRRAYATCFNAHGRATHTKPAVKCLLH
ncbi:probable polygalacturonase At3g15720 isoform X2 [Diospyros lotus]|uniref:probable polygalacturonase At3g15720 isoform X2 n=1 Tax=Diospyros lotus TaxID=55363 RepID=UPI0022535308|nr:probable polygalacturonase At3g15720 isoform X2 [Diospyros lotus]